MIYIHDSPLKLLIFVIEVLLLVSLLGRFELLEPLLPQVLVRWLGAWLILLAGAQMYSSRLLWVL